MNFLNLYGQKCRPKCKRRIYFGFSHAERKNKSPAGSSCCFYVSGGEKSARKCNEI